MRGGPVSRYVAVVSVGTCLTEEWSNSVTEQRPTDEAVDGQIVPPGKYTAPPEDAPGDAPEYPDGPVRVGESPEEEELDPKEKITALTEEEREQFRSLLTVGKRLKKIHVLERPVIISSLMADDVLRIGLHVQDYRDTQAFAQAYQAATVAASVKKLEGTSWEDTLEMNPDPDVLFRKNWERTIELYPLVIQYIYNEVVTLDAEFAELAAKLGKLSG